MEPEGWPLDAAAACARLQDVIRRLDCESEDDSLELLSALLCAAWGTVTAQNQ